MADFTGVVGQQVDASVSAFLDANGNPTTPLAPTGWATSNPAILVLTPSADSMTASGTLLSVGTVSILATTDGILETKSIEVNSGQPGPVASFSLNVNIGGAQAKPARK